MTICFSLLIVGILIVNRLNPLEFASHICIFPHCAHFTDSRSSHEHMHTTRTLTTARRPILHTATVRSEAWSVSLSDFQFLSNISSSSHQPTVKESLYIDISWQRPNGLTVLAWTLESEINFCSRHTCSQMFIKWAVKAPKCSWLGVRFLCISLWSHFLPWLAKYSWWMQMPSPVG